MNTKIALTKKGFQQLNDELSRMKRIDRPAIAKAIGDAREHGDLAENAEYHAAREQQGHIEDRILELEDIHARSNVIETSKLDGDRVMFGAKVTIINEDTEEEASYQIVSEYESDLTIGLISNTSPIGRALIGKEIGETISFEAPSGEKYFEILEVDYRD